MPSRRIVSSTRFVSVENDDGCAYHFNLRNLLYAVENSQESIVTLVFSSGHELELQDHVASLLIEELRSKNLSERKIHDEQMTDTAFEFSLDAAEVDASEISVLDEESDVSDIPARINAAMKQDRSKKKRRK